MWNRRTTSLLAATAVGLTMSLTGCGSGSSGPDAGSTPPATAVSPHGSEHGSGHAPAHSAGQAPSSALVTWAGGMCRVVSAHTQPVRPATIDRTDPKATIDAMSHMFGTMAGLLTAQHRELETLAAPPAGADRRAFMQSLARLARAEAVMHRAELTLQRASGVPSPNIVRTLRSAGAMTVDGKTYPGFVVDLAHEEPTLRAAITAAPDCHAFAIA